MKASSVIATPDSIRVKQSSKTTLDCFVALLLAMTRPMSRRTWFLALAILASVAATEFAMGRNPICTCGSVDLWVGAPDSPKTSQMLADWDSLSHIVHGLLLYAALWLLARGRPPRTAVIISMLVEGNMD